MAESLGDEILEPSEDLVLMLDRSAVSEVDTYLSNYRPKLGFPRISIHLGQLSKSYTYYVSVEYFIFEFVFEDEILKVGEREGV